MATIGLLSAGPTLALANGPGGRDAGARLATGPGTGTVLPTVGGMPFVVYVSEPSSGIGTILVGEQAIPLNDRSIVQSLQQAIV